MKSPGLSRARDGRGSGYPRWRPPEACEPARVGRPRRPATARLGHGETHRQARRRRRRPGGHGRGVGHVHGPPGLRYLGHPLALVRPTICMFPFADIKVPQTGARVLTSHRRGTRPAHLAAGTYIYIYTQTDPDCPVSSQKRLSSASSGRPSSSSSSSCAAAGPTASSPSHI